MHFISGAPTRQSYSRALQQWYNSVHQAATAPKECAALAGDTNVIKVGVEGTQAKTYIAGIDGAGIGSPVPVVINSTGTGQLGIAGSSERLRRCCSMR